MIASNCPKCGRPLKINETGRIGRCSLHKQWFALVAGAEGEAAAQNAADEKAEEQSRLEKERQEQESIRQEQEQQHSAAVKKAAAALIAILAIGVCIVFLIVKPSVNYKSAETKFAEGSYEEALEIYKSLKSYRDSQTKASFCSAMSALHNGDADAAAETLADLIASGKVAADTSLANAYFQILGNWKENGFAPENVLHLLSVNADAQFGDGAIDEEEISLRVHSGLLDGDVLEYHAYDVDGDGEKELVVLYADYSVSAFRMVPEGNTPVKPDKETLSDIAAYFAEENREKDPETALQCYQTAYDLFPSDEKRDALAACYKQTAEDLEYSGDLDAAIVDAEQALFLTQAREDFEYFYALNLKRCKGNQYTSGAIAEWEAFREDNEQVLKKYSADKEWQTDAGELHLARATELAVNRDISCADEIQKAFALGVDISETINSAMAHFEEGLALTKLRIMAIHAAEGDEELQADLITQMEEGIRTSVREWKTLGIQPTEVPLLLKTADEQNVDLSGIDRAVVYEEAAVDASGQPVHYSFVDLDEDGYEELIGIDKIGCLSLYGIKESWDVISSIQTDLDKPDFYIAGADTPVIVTIAANKDRMAVFSCTEKQLKEVFREEGICRVSRTDNTVSFSRELEGSINRYEDYSYQAIDATSRPERTGIDWQQDAYPLPESGFAAVQRYFETKAYDIPEEAERITEASNMELFSSEALFSLPKPRMPEAVDIQAYYTDDNAELFEVCYEASGREVRTWVCTIFDDYWKVSGCSETYGEDRDPSIPDYTVPLISLNSETMEVIKSAGGKRLYRILTPTSGSLTLVWKAGEKEISKAAFAVSLYKGEPYGDPEISYSLKPSASRQQTNPIYVSPDVYYVLVEAKTNDAYEYTLQVKLDESAYVELEDNNSSGTATDVLPDISYRGALLTSSDMDYYAVEMEDPGGINVVLETSGNKTKSSIYTVEFYEESSGRILTTLGVPGNTQYAETGNVYVDAGKYLIKIYKGKDWTGETYTITVNTDHKGRMEAEYNDTIEAATPTTINEEIYASIAQEGDIDCFAFTLDHDGVIQLQFGFTPTESSSKTYVLTLMDGERTELQQIKFGGKESAKVNAPLAVKPGTYFLRVENPSYIKQEYSLFIAYQETENSEEEPNNSLAMATNLQIGQAITGVISSQEDVDYYKVYFEEKQQVSLAFSFPQRTSTNKVFVFSIESNGQTVKQFDLKGDSGGMEAVIEFPAGEYYLKVKPSTWSSVVYTIGIQ